MKNLQNTAILLTLLLLVGHTLYEKFRDRPLPIVAEEAYQGEHLLIELPDAIDFCGESVPLKEASVRERLDYDLHANSFFHSNTILILKRANRWFPQMREILKKHRIPEDFLYVAVIESGLQNVVSPAGAVGFWQFMEGTAKEMGLEINKEVDERYHPIKATEAACKYLKQAHAKFGNWTLVAASYNMGMNGLAKQLERQQAQTYYDLSLNTETARYIYRVLAMKEILNNPERYHFRLPPRVLYWQAEVKEVEVAQSITDMAAFARQHGISYGTLKYYNPWLLTDRLTVKEGQTYLIAIPADKGADTNELMPI